MLLQNEQLLSSLVDAAERLRQFSPVKEQLSTAVLEEVRFRLYRIVSTLYCFWVAFVLLFGGLGRDGVFSSLSSTAVLWEREAAVVMG